MNPDHGLAVLARLTEEVEHLAAHAAAQRAYLHAGGFGDLVDELALEFDDSSVLVNQLCELGLVSDDARNALIRLHERLTSMSGQVNASLWRTEALETAPEWQDVRSLATNALMCLVQGARGR